MIPNGKSCVSPAPEREKSGNAAHTYTGARIQGTGKPILPPMAESMRGPLKIVPSPKRQHHFTRTMPIPQREPHFHTPRTPHFRHMSRESAPGAGGLGSGVDPAPCLLLALFTSQARKSKQTNHCTTPRPGGRRTSPACGSCRRPLKKCENQGIEESNGGRKKYSASKEGTLRPSREGTKCIIFLPILERESKSRKKQ